MTTVISDDCSTITIDSINLSPLNQSVKLVIKINCLTEYLLDIEVGDSDIIITPTTISLPDAEAIPDGVYLFELTIVKQDSSVVVERKCILVNCGLNCMMLDSFKAMAMGDTIETNKALAYYALISAEGCNECSCDDMCLLFNTTNLTQCNIYATTGCGCS